MRRALPVLAALATLLLAACRAEPAAPVDPAPVLWAWERPEDFSFLAPGEARVAVLFATITLRGPQVEIYGRRQPLVLPPGMRPIPVVRIETREPSLDARQRQRLVEELARRADPQIRPALQIDFDARLSERAFYRGLLDELAARLGPEAPLSITALVSWCLDDRWLDGAPVAEAVPMLFDMGPESAALRARLENGSDLIEPLCRHSYGLALDEPWPPRRPGRTLYLFSDRAFRRELLAGIRLALRPENSAPRKALGNNDIDATP